MNFEFLLRSKFLPAVRQALINIRSHFSFRCRAPLRSALNPGNHEYLSGLAGISLQMKFLPGEFEGETQMDNYRIFYL